MTKGRPTQQDIQNWLIEQLSATLFIPAADVEVRVPFLDYGLGSMEAVVMSGELADWLGKPLSPTLVWDYPTIEELAAFLAGQGQEAEVDGGGQEPVAPRATNEPIAIIGIGCRFPGATGVEAFWQLLHEGVDAISEAPHERWGGNSGNLNARWGGFTDGVQQFDSAFFGIAPREAERMDPQQRLLAEVAWEALEDAGCAVERLAGSPTGVFVGISSNDYGRIQRSGESDVYLATGNAFSIAANRLSYLFDFKGPSLSIDTACSSSLVAVHLACESLWRGETTLALAAGVNVILDPQLTESFYEAGMLAPDGRCKTFDASANGYVRGEGVGVVVLKPLSQALADGDDIYAVVDGTAVNQDGRSNGLTAPNRLSQEAVLKAAYAKAGIEPKDVQYVEAHGTGTALGDPIEAMALGAVLSQGRSPENACRIGSLKTNIGHLEAAAGIAGLIKVALSLKHGMIPASLHFDTWNPHIPHQQLPLQVNRTLTPWPEGSRVAGVSSFGFGGTNAHVVLEAAPARDASSTSREQQVLVLSAKTKTALEQMTDRLRDHLAQQPDLSLADAAYTLQVGRQAFQHRRMLVGRDVHHALQILESRDPKQLLTSVCDTNHGKRSVSFLFSGTGSQYVGMAAELYEKEIAFRDAINTCCDFLQPILGVNLRNLLYPIEGEDAKKSSSLLNQTVYAQPALFVVEYALARLLQKWGIEPDAMLGHSLGEYVAACLAGVFSLEDALTLVAKRAQMIHTLPPGGMLAVQLTEEEVLQHLHPELSLAAVNSPQQCVVAGTIEAIEGLQTKLAGMDVECTRVHTTSAFHSHLVEPILEDFTQLVRGFHPQPPAIPFVSNVTGTWITNEQATDPGYWARHLRQTVRFSEGVLALGEQSARILLEVGPGRTLSSFARQVAQAHGLPGTVLNTLRHVKDDLSDLAFLLGAIGKLWLAGYDVQWDLLHADETRRRVALPTYPFEHKRHWLDAEWLQSARKSMNPSDWFYAPAWRTSHVTGSDMQAHVWVVFLDGIGVGDLLAERLRQTGHTVLTVSAGATYAKPDAHHYVLSPDDPHDYTALWEDIRSVHNAPDRVVHLWSLSEAEDRFDSIQRAGYYSLLRIAQTLTTPYSFWAIGNGLYQLDDRDETLPAKATLIGAAKVMQQELPFVTSRVVDLSLSSGANALEKAVACLLAEVSSGSLDREVAYRGNQRWVKQFESLDPSSFVEPGALVRKHGTYVILGGFGHVGQTLARYLAEHAQACLVLVSRGKLPERSQWDLWLQQHDEADATTQRIRHVLALEALGSRVLVCQADVGDEQQMRNVLQQARTEFGEVHGILHAAGLSRVQATRAITETDADSTELHFAPKVQGTYVLERLLRDQSIDFCLIVSSLAAELGGMGTYAYTAAHNFIDAFVRQQNQVSSTLWLSFNWDDQTLNRPEEVLARALSRRGVIPFLVSTEELNHAYHTSFVGETGPSEEIAHAEASELHARPELGTIYAAPRTPTEEQIAALWQELLGIAQVGIHDNFFDLGGNSLIGTKFVNRVRQLFQVNLPIQAMFDANTVSELAVTIEQKQAQSSGITSIPRQERHGLHELSHAQERLWFGYQLGQPDAGNLYAAEVHGDLQTDVFLQAVQALVERHDIMRTTITERDGEFFQEVHENLVPPIVLHDWRALDDEAQTERLYHHVVQEQQTTFDLVKESFFRINLFKMADDRHLFLMTAHHIGYDGWSLTVLLKDLQQLYLLLLDGRSPSELDPALQYADYAVWQNQRLRQGELEPQKQYWLRQLADDLEVPHLPHDDMQEINHDDSGFVVFTPDSELEQGIRALAVQTENTLYQTVLAAFNIWLSRVTRHTTVTVGTTLSGRTHPELEDVMGLMINPAAMRTDLSGNPSGLQVLERVKETAYGAYANQDYPYDLVIQGLEHQQNPTLYHVVFMGQNVPVDAESHMRGIRIKLVSIEQSLSNNGRNLMGNSDKRMFNQFFDLMVSLMESEKELVIEARYNTDRLRAETVRGYMEQFESVLRHLVVHPDDRLSHYDALEEDDVLDELFG